MPLTSPAFTRPLQESPTATCSFMTAFNEVPGVVQVRLETSQTRSGFRARQWPQMAPDHLCPEAGALAVAAPLRGICPLISSRTSFTAFALV